MFPSRFRSVLRRYTASAVAALLLITLVGRESRTRAQSLSRLTQVLADVAASVRQDGASASGAATSAAAPGVSSLPKSAQDAIRARALRLDAAGSIQVYVNVTDVSMDVLQQLATAGVRVQISDAPSRRVQAAVPMSRLQTVAALPFVTFVTLPSYAHRRTGAVTTEGDSILHADTARQAFGLDGTGVKVGVISDGLKGVFATGCTNCGGVAGGPIATGDLPSATGSRTASGKLTNSSGGITGQSMTDNNDLEGLAPGCTFAGAGAEGTALLEIVHDLAPAAQLSFINVDTDIEMNQAVNTLAQANDVVVDDLGFFDLPYDGTNIVSRNTAAALNNNANRIRTYITANGNDSDEHYFGGYVDSGVDGTTVPHVSNAGHFHLFQSSSTTSDVLSRGPQPFNLISLPSGNVVRVVLTWDDPAGASGNNYDLYLVRDSDGSVVATSTNRQAGSIDPQENLPFQNTGAAGLFRIYVQNVGNQAAPKNLDILVFSGECDPPGPALIAPGHIERLNYNTPSHAVIAQSDAGGSPVSVLSVGAICSASTNAANAFPTSSSCQDPSHSTAEFYSSQGPTLDGRVKPDVTGIDGVAITAAGQFENPFFGTSAAAPHIAGEAALLLQAASCLSATDSFGLDAANARGKLRNLITSSADARSGSPPDNIFGAGLANVQKAVQATLPVFSGSSSTIVVSGNVAAGARLNGSQLGFTDPDGCPLRKLSWTGGCGSSPDTAMTCPLGTSGVSVAVSNGGPAFSQPTPLTVTVTSFNVSPAPGSATVTAGQSASYVVTLAPQSGAFTNPIALSCSGLPQGAACSFNPSTLTPGASSAASTLTVTTTGKAPLSAAVWTPGSGTPAMWAIATAAGAGFGLLLMTWMGSAVPRRRRVTIAATAVTLLAFALQIACSSNNNNNNNSNGSTTVALSQTSLSFPSQSTGTTSPPQATILTNTGSAALSISGIVASGDFAQSNTCGTSLAAGASCSITATFTPTAAGARTGSITITDNASGSPQHVTLTGTGVNSNGPTPPGSYTIAVNGTSGTLVKTGTLGLNVQ